MRGAMATRGTSTSIFHPPASAVGARIWLAKNYERPASGFARFCGRSDEHICPCLLTIFAAMEVPQTLNEKLRK